MEYLTVCDVSRHNGEIDFNVMKAAGAVGVAIRATVGAYYTDPMFYTNWDGAGAAGLFRTAYHVTRPDHSAEIQIQRFFNVIASRTPDFGKYGWVADNEVTGGQSAQRITNVLWSVMSAFTIHGGAPCMNYTRAEWFNRNTFKGDWKRFPLWVARYTNADEPWKDGSIFAPRDYDDWQLWQYSADGNLRGCEFGALPEPGAPPPSMDISRAKAHIFAGETPPEPPPIPPAPHVPPTLSGYTTMMVLVDKMNVRAGPGTSYKIVGSLGKGDIVKVHDVAGTSAWIRMENGAWVAAQYGSRKYLEPKS